MGDLMKIQALKQKSERLRIPFRNLCVAYARETILLWLSESTWSGKLVAARTGELHESSYRCLPSPVLNFYFAGMDEFTPETVKQMAVEIFRGRTTREPVYQIGRGGGSFQILASVPLDTAEVTIRIRVLAGLWEEALLRKETLPFTGGEPAFLTVYEYIPEAELAEDFCQCIEYLELIPDMSIYLDSYEKLVRENLDGRKVMDCVTSLCQKRGIGREKKRLDTLLSYRDYPYMKKKWAGYIRKERKSGPEWESVIDKFEAFYGEIWECIAEDRIFLGDWMPEIGRYL